MASTLRISPVPGIGWVVRLFRYIRFTVLKGRGVSILFLHTWGQTLNKPRVTKPVSGRADSSDRSVWCSEVTCMTPMLRHTWCPLCTSVVGGLMHLPGALGLFTALLMPLVGQPLSAAWSSTSGTCVYLLTIYRSLSTDCHRLLRLSC